MKKLIPLLFATLLMCLVLSSCSAKLYVICPTLFYKRDGKCTDDDGHLYEAVYYNGDRLELSVFINEDGSVCKDEGHYVLSEKDEAMVKEDLENWAKAFEPGE